MALKKIDIDFLKEALKEAARTNGNKIHIVPSNNAWILKKKGLKAPSGKYPTREQALEVALRIKKLDGQIIIHKLDGSVDLRIAG